MVSKSLGNALTFTQEGHFQKKKMSSRFSKNNNESFNQEPTNPILLTRSV